MCQTRFRRGGFSTDTLQTSRVSPRDLCPCSSCILAELEVRDRREPRRMLTNDVGEKIEEEWRVVIGATGMYVFMRTLTRYQLCHQLK